jgi:hypothetical protein
MQQNCTKKADFRLLHKEGIYKMQDAKKWHKKAYLRLLHKEWIYKMQDATKLHKKGI